MIYIDAVNLVFLLVCIKMGLYGEEDHAHEEEDVIAKDTGYMDHGQFEDVPLNQELDHIIEQSEEDWETSMGSFDQLKPIKLLKDRD